MIAVFDIVLKGERLNKPIAVELNGHDIDYLGKGFVFLSWLCNYKGNVFNEAVRVME